MPTGKHLWLTERDVAILRMLHRFRFLRATHLVSLLRPVSQKRFIERLGDLYHEAGLIDRPAPQWRRFNARYQPAVYELSSAGAALLRRQGDLPARAVTFSAGGRDNPAPHFDHAMMIVDALVEAELATGSAPDQRFVPVDEILARMPPRSCDRKAPAHPLAASVTILPQARLPFLTKPVTTHIVPDALYGIEHLVDGVKRYRFYALECENKSPRSRSSLRQSSTNLKLAAYDAFIGARRFRETWGIPNLELRLLRTNGSSAG